MKLIRGHAPNGRSEKRSATFTGEVWLDPVLPTVDGFTVNNVFFTPGARTYWHYHERGQFLHVTLGLGLICSEGEAPYVLEPGNTVWVPGGERHWHGGGIDCCLQHLAISLGKTTWLDPVSESEYRAPVANPTALGAS